MWPTAVVVSAIPGKGGSQVALAEDQDAVGEFGPAAVLAGGLWAAQGLIWTLGPKVQAVDPPYRITDRPHFALFWLAIVGALLCSATALLGLLRGGDRRARTRWVTSGRPGRRCG